MSQVNNDKSKQSPKIFDEEHWADLQRSGITLETAVKAGLYSIVDSNAIKEHLGFLPAGVKSALAFPYEPGGFTRFKVFPPFKNAEGKEAKYLQPKGSPVRLYVPFSGWEDLQLNQDPIYIAEGEKKALKADQDGLRPVVAVAGVWSWKQKGSEDLISDFTRIDLEGRIVFLIPDSDFFEKPDVMMGFHRLGRKLEALGANVIFLVLPGNGEKKVGLDDYLLTHSADEVKHLPALTLDDPAFLGNFGFLLADMFGNELPDDPRSAIRAVITGKSISQHDRLRMVAHIVHRALSDRGDLYRTKEGHCFYFERKEKRLYEFGSLAFDQLIIEATGLSQTERYFRFSLDVISAFVARSGPLVRPSTMGWFDAATGAIAVSDGTSGMWITREGTADWSYADNGENGVIFVTEPEAERWQPDFSGDGSDLDWFIASANFAGNQEQVEDQRVLSKMWLVSVFFNSILPTRVIPTFLGQQGSGKSTCCRMIGRLLVGPSFNVSGLRVDKEDAFVASLTHRLVHAADNADSHIRWLPDALARYATGETFRMRRLYTTNDEVSYAPRAILLLTSRDPYFRRPDVAERLLPFNLKRLELFWGENQLFTELQHRRNRIMGDLLRLVKEAALALAATTSPNLSFRMADFASFGWRIFKSRGDEKRWEQLLARLETTQSEFAAEGDILVEVIRTFLAQTPKPRPRLSTGELFERCRPLAEGKRLPFPRTAQSFGKAFWDRQRPIEVELHVRVHKEIGQGGRAFVTFVDSSDGTPPVKEVTEGKDF